ncbi:hypothetical protein [Streptacidiphilus sp. EB129]|uniref:hypothetical protein n=1 Tax=Streptacidiphilus sp. EB129 TaxID=3156262 RepID=UPI0035115AAB
MSTSTTSTADRLRRQALVSTWLFTGLVLAGNAWALGLRTTWWERVLLALPLLALAVMDSRGVELVVETRIALTRGLALLGWMQVPLAVAGGSWWAGVHADLGTRLALAAAIGLVVVLIRYAPSAPAPAGGP